MTNVGIFDKFTWHDLILTQQEITKRKKIKITFLEI